VTDVQFVFNKLPLLKFAHAHPVDFETDFIKTFCHRASKDENVVPGTSLQMSLVDEQHLQ